MPVRRLISSLRDLKKGNRIFGDESHTPWYSCNQRRSTSDSDGSSRPGRSTPANCARSFRPSSIASLIISSSFLDIFLSPLFLRTERGRRANGHTAVLHVLTTRTSFQVSYLVLCSVSAEKKCTLNHTTHAPNKPHPHRASLRIPAVLRMQRQLAGES